MEVIEKLRHQLIVSCQAREGQPFNSPDLLSKMAEAAEMGGAKGIRADKPENISKIKEVVSLPIIGIYKKRIPGKHVFITPSYEDAVAIIAAGADIVGIECTFQDNRKEELPLIIEKLKQNSHHPLLADVSTLEEAVFAQKIGFDLVATTLNGYTSYTSYQKEFDFNLLDNMIKTLTIPVIAEGHIKTPIEAVKAIQHGAYSVVVGKAITMPSEITKWFVEALKNYEEGLD